MNEIEINKEEVSEDYIASAKLESLNVELKYYETKNKMFQDNKLAQIEIELIKIQIKYLKKHYAL